ncbi:HNH endonuclease signature motif containing protein [Dyadobacter sp. LHD-138]|uniref:HNH endonuclease signature motif containing protein n=1 Tax=Dyadobacter sp. LHD-138 TaxID=3071413 RepID=UPI0027E114C9|nr:HNH endonuclease signature motif containing protein [Dyadobacter sp. LHD-138]MDQ6477832.1 HNH endonuclease signature motif containing protein [Dyadobacter sp. LHD-138]
MELKRRIWTDAEVEIFKRIYPDQSSADIAAVFGKSLNQVYNLAQELGVKKSEEYLKSTQSGRIVGGDLGIPYRFTKGFTPHNKGKEMPAEIYEKVKGTMFKKGIIPANSKKEGDISIRNAKNGFQYYFIRVEKKWIPLARHVYENLHGQIPKGLLITHIDGNTLNVEPDNLKMITRGENSNRNRNREKASETMRRLYREGKVNNPMINASDQIVANWIAPRNKQLQTEVLKHPELIELKRNQIKLRRSCKQQN